MHRKIFVLISALILTAIIGYVDVLTGQEILLTIFYLIPVAITVWYVSLNAGIPMALLNGAVWYYAQIKSGAVRSHALLLYWETFILTAFLLIVAILLGIMKDLLKKEREMARTDYLTGLANRRYFFEIVESEISRDDRKESTFTIAYIDADNFKNVNDTMGHHTGDKVLKAVSTIMKKNIRKMDTAARLGGDEFAILLPEAGSLDVKNVIEKIRFSLLDDMKKNAYPVTFSVGVVVFKQYPGTADNAIKMADALMYDVKKEGKNNLKFSVY
jgi:diguanylate cyclase (GGDEF)-like protein